MSTDDAEPTVRTPRDPADPEPTRVLPPERPIAGPVVPEASTTAGPTPGAPSAVGAPGVGGGSASIPAPGSNAPYRQAPARSVTQRSFGRPEPLDGGFRPAYPGQAWPTQRPAYTPPPPLDWHQQQARAYTPAPPPKNNRTILIAAIVALIVGLIAGTGAAVSVVALDNNNGPVDDPSGPAIGVGADPKIRSGSVSAVAATLLPSVVQLKVDGADNSSATGSGFAIDNAGHILTNNHVVAAAAKGGSIQVVTQKGKSSTARLVGRSPAYDLAVVQVVGLDAPSVQFGQSELAVVGQDVVAIGSPLGLAGTVTSGIVSAKNRPVTAGGEGEISYINALQTDAAINPGNSGGPLVDMNARVIGINSAIATVRGAEEGTSGSIGLGFAIPIDQARRTAQQLIESGKASYPVIGANVDMQFEGGARVSEVNAGSPAARAGLRTGDVITKINGLVVESAEALIVAIRTHRPGENVRLEFERGGKPRQVTVALGQQTG
ncbi:S1C family serine protease [Kribbella monticola]|uniref:S1C family serine protease n=1 Tax=Kribbella monticola TaxID=2185285 RepID=UPI000DD2DABF|nr:trypsin-like peptidase domain-containing protein [Kribbella monticola]